MVSKTWQNSVNWKKLGFSGFQKIGKIGKSGRFCEFNNFRAKNRFDRFARVICFKTKITLFTRVLWNGICWEKMMGMRHELHPLLSSSNFLFRPPPKHAIDKSRPKRHSNCPKCYSTFNKNWKLSARKTNKRLHSFSVPKYFFEFWPKFSQMHSSLFTQISSLQFMIYFYLDTSGKQIQR